jgi:hypothetical protein
MIMLFFLSLPAGLSAQELIEEDEESPYLWTFELGDSNVDLFWDGYWRFHFSTGLALKIEDDIIMDKAVFPGYTPGFRFLQTPDLLLSLWLDNRFFFEASVVEDYEKNTYLLGFQGTEEEYLQSVRIGNSSILTDSYADLSVTAPAFNTPGISLKGKKGRVENELMVRLDGTWEDSRFYIGSFEAQEEYHELFDYQRAVQFVLPDTSVTNLKVYLENSQGEFASERSGIPYKYNLASEGDYLFDTEKGLLTIIKAQTGRIAVYYESGGLSIGHDSLGVGAIVPPTKAGSGIPDVNGTLQDFDWATTDDPYSPGTVKYQVTRQEILNGQNCLLIYEPDRFSPFACYGIYSYQQTPSADEWLNDIHLTERYGTEQKEPDDLSWNLDRANKQFTLYRSGKDSRSALYRYPLGDIIPEIYGNAPVKESGLLPYQLQFLVKRGQEGYRLGSGVVPGSVEVTLNDHREYNFTLDEKTGTIEFKRYIFPQDRIVINYRRESLNFQGQEMLVYQGNRFILSEKNILEQATSFNWIFPDGEDSSTPDGGTVQTAFSWEHKGDSLNVKTVIQGELDLGDADGIERIMGMETALSSYPLFTEALAEPAHDSTFTSINYLPPTQPLTAVDPPSGTPFDSPIVSVELPALTSASDQWSGVDVKLSNRGTVDYSHLEALRFYLKDNNGTIDQFIVKLGETGENTDWDGSGIIDPSQDSLTFEVDKTSSLNGNWTQIEIPLPPADRQKLTRCRSLKFIFSETTDGSTEGSVLLGGIEFIGQTFNSSVINDASNDASLTITERTDPTLAQSYPHEIGQFHKSGEAQRVSHFKWDNTTVESDYWEAVRWMNDKSLTRFGKIIFFVNTDGNATNYSLNLTDINDRGIHLDWLSQAGISGWQKVTINLSDRQAYFDKGADNIFLKIDPDLKDLNKILIRGYPGLSSESFYLDEIYFDESLMDLGGRGQVSFDYKASEVLTGPEGFRWIGDISLSGDTWGTLHQQLGGLALSSRSLSFQSVLDMELIYTGIEISMDGTLAEEQSSLWGGHSVTLPAVDSPLTVRDTFALGDGESRPSFSHESEILLKPFSRLSSTLGHKSTQINNKLSQNWMGSSQLSFDSVQLRGALKGAEFSYEPLRGKAYEDVSGSTDYGGVWLDSWYYILPDRTEILSRNLSQELSLNAVYDSVKVNFSQTAGTNTGYRPLWSQTNRYATQMDIPIMLKGDITLTPRYTRTLERTSEEDFSDSFSMDFQNWASEIFPIFPLTSYLPFREIWGNEPVEEIAPDSGNYTYRPSFSLAMDRRYGSRLEDLFIPSSLEAAFTRTYIGQSSSFYYENLWKFSLRQRALNLFGQFGVFPLFTFYTTEEIANSFDISFSAKNALLPLAKNFSWNSYQRFEGAGGGRFSLENDLIWDFQNLSIEERLRSSYHWQLGRQAYRRIPLSSYILDQESYVGHDENLEYSLMNTSEKGQTHNISGSHFSTLYIEEFGTIKGWIKLGCQLDDNSALYGTEFGMELTLTF